MKNKPKIENELRMEKEKLENVAKDLKTLKSKIEDNKTQLEKSKIHLQSEVDKKNELEDNLLKVEEVLGQMRKELKRIIRNSNQPTFIEPEGYREFRKEAYSKLISQLQQESNSITTKVIKKEKVSFTMIIS